MLPSLTHAMQKTVLERKQQRPKRGGKDRKKGKK